MMPRGLVSCVKGWQKAQQLLTACRGVGLGRFRESSEGVAGGKEQTSERQNPGEAATWQEEKKEQPRAVCIASTKTTLYRKSPHLTFFGDCGRFVSACLFLHLNTQRNGFELSLEDSLDYYGHRPLRCALTLHCHEKGPLSPLCSHP